VWADSVRRPASARQGRRRASSGKPDPRPRRSGPTQAV